MNFQDSVKTCLKKYIDFSGRASRSEYWWFILFGLIVGIITGMISQYLYYATTLALLLPTLTVMVRRLHDVDKSGWGALLLLIPIIGPLIIFYFTVIEGSKGPNRFGNPVA